MASLASTNGNNKVVNLSSANGSSSSSGSNSGRNGAASTTTTSTTAHEEEEEEEFKTPGEKTIEKLDILLKEKEAELKALKLPKNRRYNFTTAIQEERKKGKHAIYNIAYCDFEGVESIFAAVGGNRVSVYESVSDGHIDLKQVYVDDDDTEDYYCCRWTFDEVNQSPLLLCGGAKGIVKVIDCRRQMLCNGLIGHGNSINEICVHPVDHWLIFTASKDESIRLWNLTNRVCIAIFAGEQGHRDEVLSMDIHLLGNCFASCGMDNSIKIWNIFNGKCIKNLTGHTNKIMNIK